jgi:hypothetical protein
MRGAARMEPNRPLFQLVPEQSNKITLFPLCFALRARSFPDRIRLPGSLQHIFACSVVRIAHTSGDSAQDLETEFSSFPARRATAGQNTAEWTRRAVDGMILLTGHRRARNRRRKDYEGAGIAGSPRKGGNTDVLVRNVLQGVASNGIETELIRLAEHAFPAAPAAKAAGTPSDAL